MWSTGRRFRNKGGSRIDNIAARETALLRRGGSGLSGSIDKEMRKALDELTLEGYRDAARLKDFNIRISREMQELAENVDWKYSSSSPRKSPFCGGWLYGRIKFPALGNRRGFPGP